MTHEEKINYMRIACQLSDLNMPPKLMDKMVSCYELVIKKEGKANISDIVKLNTEVEKRHYVEPQPEENDATNTPKPER